MKKLKNLVMSLSLMFGLVGAPLLATQAVSAANPAVQPANTISQLKSGVNKAGGSGQPGLTSTVKKIINVLLFLIGLIAVIMIIIGGLRYTTSAGDSNAASGAKNTIIYAVVGLIVAIVSYGIVNFVLGHL